MVANFTLLLFAHSWIVSSNPLWHKQFNLTSVICLHTVKYVNISMWPIHGSLIGTSSLGQSEPGNDDNGRILNIPPKLQDLNFTIRCSLVSYPGQSLCLKILLLCRDEIGVFYSLSRMGWGHSYNPALLVGFWLNIQDLLESCLHQFLTLQWDLTATFFDSSSPFTLCLIINIAVKGCPSHNAYPLSW